MLRKWQRSWRYVPWTVIPALSQDTKVNKYSWPWNIRVHCDISLPLNVPCPDPLKLLLKQPS